MMMKVTLLLLCLFFTDLALSNGGPGPIPPSLEEEFTFHSHSHLPIEFGINGSINYKLPFVAHDGKQGERNLELFIHPLAIFGFDKVDRVVSLGTSNSSSLQQSQKQDRFLHIKSFKWDLGLGVEIETYLKFPLTLGIGPSYLRGKNYYRETILNSRYEKRDKLRIPKTSEEFNKWRIGDKITFGARSSFIFGASVSYSVINTGVLVSSTGQYIIKFQKVSDTNLEVRITNLKTKARTLVARALIVAGELERYAARGNGFTFSYNMKSTEAVKALKQTLIGNLTLAQKIAKTDASTVEEISSYNSIHNGNTQFSKFYIPLLYTYQKSRNKDYAIINKEFISDDETKRISISSITKENRTRGPLSKHMINSETIRVITVEDINKDEQSVLASNVYWKFEKDKTTVSELKGFLSSIAKRTGISRINDIKIPGGKLDFTRVQVAVNLSAQDVFVLFNEVSIKIIKANAIAKLIRDFTTFGHKRFCKIKKESKCFRLYRNFILNAVKKIISNRDLANSLFKTGEKKLALNKVNYILKSLVDSNYLLKAFVAQAPNLDIKFSIEGENIKRSTIEL